MQLILEWIKKFFGGFNPASSANWGKWIFYAVVFTVYMTVYNHFNPPPTRQAQTITAETVVNEAPKAENKKKFFLGVTILGWGLGLFAE